MSKNRVLIIGLDGATWDLIKPWAQEGKLPTFRKLMTKGSYATMGSTIPPITFPAVPSFVTGKNPCKHGVCSFVQPDIDCGLGLVDSRKLSDEFYEVAGMKEKIKLLVNLPLTYPAKEINGYTITGILTPNKESEGFIYPLSLKEDLGRLFETYIIDETTDVIRFLPGKEARLGIFLDMADRRSETAEYLLRNKKWDLAIIYFVILDRIQHNIFVKDDKSWLFNAYSKVDSCLDRLISSVSDETNVFIFSDHGFGLSKGRFYVNAWLRGEGFLVYKTGRRASKIGAQRLRWIQYFPGIRFLTKFIPDLLLEPIAKYLMAPRRYYGVDSIDWSKTQAFATVTGIYINKNETFAADYEKIRNDIVQRLKELRDPKSGRKLEVKVYKREELYSGSHMSEFPDIVYSIDDYAYEPHPSMEDVPSVVYHTLPRGWHREEGILLAHGPSIARGEQLHETKIYDIAPTILHLMGVPIPADMDGNVLTKVFREGSEAAKREVTYQELQNSKTTLRNRISRLRESGKL